MKQQENLTMSSYTFELKVGSKEVEVCTDQSHNVDMGVMMFTNVDQIKLIKMTDEKQPYQVLMEEQKSADKINFFCKDGMRAFQVKGDVKFYFESFTGQTEEWCKNILQNSIMGAIWKDKKLRHASPKGFTWTDDLDKADALIFDLELLNTL